MLSRLFKYLGIFTFNIEGGLKSIELDVSVPRRDLLGVSGLSKELSPTLPPNIMLGRAAEEAYLVVRTLRAPEAGTWTQDNLSESK